MAFLASLSFEELKHYHNAVARAVEVRNHTDMVTWLQGDMQRYLPHDVLIAAWGRFSQGDVLHEIISPFGEAKTHATRPSNITQLLQRLFTHWIEFGAEPVELNAQESGFSINDVGLNYALGFSTPRTHCAMVHGIRGTRGRQDFLYVVLGMPQIFNETKRSAMVMILPYIDIALRQMEHAPQRTGTSAHTDHFPPNTLLHLSHGLTVREVEILHWVAAGKTNPEIGSILEISAFTVKNHMQRVFKKLNVSNRAQAVSKLKALLEHA